jgi:16S rRNA (uracil1498-N3)-methyltransferase
MARVRLYLDQSLGAGQTLTLDRDRAHYLFGVMRLAPGDRLAVFDGRTGEWEAEVTQAGKRGGALRCLEQTKPLQAPPDLWLLFAPIKKARTDFIVEKAAEMGAARVLPVATDFTNAERVNRARLQAHAVEAAEQCGGTFVPEVAALAPLGDVLRDWPAERRLMFCDEALAGRSALLPESVAARGAVPWAILIGPEGGFSEAERARLAAMAQAVPVSLGPRVLRADTAAVAALALWQSRLGDWT